MHVSPDMLQTLLDNRILPCDTPVTAASTAIVCCDVHKFYSIFAKNSDKPVLQ